MQFSTFIKDKRLKTGLSAKGLAQKAGLHNSYISLVENGRKNPRIGNALKIAKALSMNVGDFKCIDEFYDVHGFARRRNHGAKKGK